MHHLHRCGIYCLFGGVVDRISSMREVWIQYDESSAGFTHAFMVVASYSSATLTSVRPLGTLLVGMVILYNFYQYLNVLIIIMQCYWVVVVV